MSPRRSLRFSRRQIIRGLLATTAFGAATKLSACTPASTDSTDAAEGGSAASDEIVVGFIYVGPKDDFGYNQAHAEGAAAMAEVAGIKIIEEASVPETTAVLETMRSMIEIDGATVLFPTSFGYFDPYILELATEFPEVQFFHAGGLYQDGVHPDNVGSYFGYIDEAQYVAGVVAGHTSKTGKLGFVAAKPIPQVLRNINSFTLGAKSVDPAITTQVIFTGDWALPVKEAEATNSMADQGIDVVTCHVDSPKVVMETAEKRGIFSSGYHADQSPLAPEGYLTGAEWDWVSIYTFLGEQFVAGKSLMAGDIDHILRGGLADNFCKLSAYGSAVSDEAKADADAAKDKILKGELVIYEGELKDNTGKSILSAGEKYEQQNIELEKMDWLIEGVKGSIAG
ncbi:BMP family ABC transporter substrate-binding protein [Leptolyngbya cf. ectocarpi LEGE 11479]|uniref:BMP family ABC transporter substrate-binding protein n=1 Tax=Leptolyngbya cf. ectocarpi LEGE 11479 TaxID=1828722 RepID=A0A928X2P3_LEPEC|nr:BMP family ABC transporter substrate-binding protein [Leptolyngbya ectocarpi]MBE9066681.1 BMP family ABC transporter substrate-binding protein [Leptolyngbya cf. ectocarpi LEGE 11479]